MLTRVPLKALTRLRLFAAVTTLVSALPSPLATAQDGTAAHLQISFVSGQTTFHVGEIIPLQLNFFASAPNVYEISTRNYDRSGRLNLEQFHVSPPARDPLQGYFQEGSFIGGGLGGSELLGIKPESIREELNEWLALDTPGHYTLSITSGRVSRQGGTQMVPVELESNSLDFYIVVADPAWQSAELQSAVAILDDKASTAIEKTLALRRLRFLDTPASVHELVRQLSQNFDTGCWDCVGGLAGSLHQKLVVHELEQLFAAPDIAITQNYLSIFAKLKLQLDHAPLPAYPHQDESQQKIWQQQAQVRNEQLGQLQDYLYEKAASLVTQKQGLARAQTVRTLLLRPYGPEHQALPSLPPQEIAAAFSALPAEDQYTLLSIFTERFKIVAMIPPLEALTEQPVLHHQLLRGLALRCLYELDPSAGSRRILEEIAHPHIEPAGGFFVKGKTLGILPDETLPQFDDLLASRIEKNDRRTLDLDAQLIGRYSTAAILPRVRAVYSSHAGEWDCETEDGFVVYLLRVQPDLGVQRLAAAPSACMTNSLPLAIRIHRWNEVEGSIIKSLDDPDLNRARQAAETLARYGSSPKAEQALWDRCRRFHDQWAGRDAELVYRAGMPRSANDAMSFEFGLVQAIGMAQAWILSDSEVSALEKLTVGPEVENVKQWHVKYPVDLNISSWPDGHIQGSVQQYPFQDLPALLEKLSQYPTGTHFILDSSGNGSQPREALTAINEVAAVRGLIIEPPLHQP